MFKYPLTREEIFTYSKCNDIEAVDRELNLLLELNIIYHLNGFYLKTNSPEQVDRRRYGNEMSKKIMPKALRVSKLIGKFPYVESVCLSGALSKGYFDEDGDIDFFIITKPHRLWIARTLLILYKKVFLLNSKKYFCVNYFISSDQLIITEQNRFTATELVTLIPIYGTETFKSFVKENNWTYNFFPNYTSHDDRNLVDNNKPLISKITEAICDTFIGDIFDGFFRKLTLKKWNSKFKHLKKDDFDIALKSTESVSKHHPQNFQKRVLGGLNKEYREILEKHNLECIPENA